MWLPLLYQPRRLLAALSLARAVPRSPPCMYSVTIITCSPSLTCMSGWEVTTLNKVPDNLEWVRCQRWQLLAQTMSAVV